MQSRILALAARLGVHPAYLLPQLPGSTAGAPDVTPGPSAGLDVESAAPPQAGAAPAQEAVGSASDSDPLRDRIIAFAKSRKDAQTEQMQITYRRPTGEVQTITAVSDLPGSVRNEDVLRQLNFIPPGSVILNVAHNHPLGSPWESYKIEKGREGGDHVWMQEDLPRFAKLYGLTLDPNFTATIVTSSPREPTRAFSYRPGEGIGTLIWSAPEATKP